LSRCFPSLDRRSTRSPPRRRNAGARRAGGAFGRFGDGSSCPASTASPLRRGNSAVSARARARRSLPSVSGASTHAPLVSKTTHVGFSPLKSSAIARESKRVHRTSRVLPSSGLPASHRRSSSAGRALFTQPNGESESQPLKSQASMKTPPASPLIW
jgi:hypothetical protein